MSEPERSPPTPKAQLKLIHRESGNTVRMFEVWFRIDYGKPYEYAGEVTLPKSAVRLIQKGDVSVYIPLFPLWDEQP